MGIYLHEELTFKHDFNEKINKAHKGNGVIRKLDNILLHHTLLKIYGSFVRPYLDGNVIFDQSRNDYFNNKIDKV